MTSNDAFLAPAQVILCGVAEGSPLFELMSSLLPPGTLVADRALPRPTVLWCAPIAKSRLRWWNDSATDTPPLLNAVRLDLFGDINHEGPAPIWRLVDGAGRAVLAPYSFLETVHRAPFTATLRLIGGSGKKHGEATLLGEAILSSRLTYLELLESVGYAAARLVRRALAGVPGQRMSVPNNAGQGDDGVIARGLACAGAWLRTHRARWHERLFQEDWAIGVSAVKIPELIREFDAAGSSAASAISANCLEPLEWLETGRIDGYVADPFPHPIRRDHMLCEVFANETGRGFIASAPVARDIASALSPVELGFDCHLSYPYLWQDDGHLYCLPESGAARTTKIFELTGPDEQATEIAIVSDHLAMADPSLFRMGDYYWIAYTDTDIGLHDNLCLVYSASLEGPWQPHRHNPVKWDVRSSRPGGSLFRHDGRLYRPAQNCASTYGAGLAVNEVISCDPDSYLEATVAMIMPERDNQYPAGLHTLSYDAIGARFLIDGKRYRLNGRAILHKLLKRISRLARAGS